MSSNGQAELADDVLAFAVHLMGLKRQRFNGFIECHFDAEYRIREVKEHRSLKLHQLNHNSDKGKI